MELTAQVKEYLQGTADSLRGADRRLLMTRTVRLLGPAGQRRAERELGWNRVTIRKGMHDLAYYPPYHSKYNLIERCWGVLANHWNGALLESIPTALRFAQTMTWHGKHPFVELLDKIYHRGVKLTASEMKELETQVQRLPGLEKWFVDISPG